MYTKSFGHSMTISNKPQLNLSIVLNTISMLEKYRENIYKEHNYPMSQDFISMKGKVSIELQRLGIDRKCQFDAINALNGVKKLNEHKWCQREPKYAALSLRGSIANTIMTLIVKTMNSIH